jgi:predicted nuclease with RNAse H fold
MTDEAFAGIDVAVARNKRLPVAVCSWVDGRLEAIPLREWDVLPPRLPGNLGVLDRQVRRCLAQETVKYLRAVEKCKNMRITRVGIDAPRAPKKPSAVLRACEAELVRLGIGFIKTPDSPTFAGIPGDVSAHLASPGTRKGLPHANRIWMLFGFELFEALSKAGWECLEVYPQATARAIGAGERHKSRAGAALHQFRAAAMHTGWPARGSLADLRGIAFGSLHDCLDAYLSAWVASLPEERLEAVGIPPDDVIWRPRV